MSLATFFEALKKDIENAISDVDQAIAPGVKYLEANVPAAAISIAEALLAGAVTGTPWATLTATLVSQAEAQGIALAETAAKITLNTAQNNLLAKDAASPQPAPSVAPTAVVSA